MIIETIFSTLDPSGRPNFAPMGVTWGDEELIVRPFRATHTWRNLSATGFGVANITDDAGAFVDTALVGEAELPYFAATAIPGVVCANACYWRELQVVQAAGTLERAEFRCRVAGQGRLRDFLGFSRARAAVIEAAILATRLHLVGPEATLQALAGYEAIVAKTGDLPERQALERVRDYVREHHYETDR